MSPDQTRVSSSNVNIVYVAPVLALFFIAIGITAIVLVIYKTQYRHKRHKFSNNRLRITERHLQVEESDRGMHE